MSTTTNTSSGPSVGERIMIGAAASVLGALIGTILFPGAGTALGAKIGAIFGGGSAS